MKKGRLLLPWGLLAGLLLWTVAIDGLGIKPVSVLKKPRITLSNQTTTTTTTEATELTSEGEVEEEVGATAADTETVTNATSSNSLLTGDPQHDYKYDPNLPRELPPGYNLSAYPFFSRVPNDVTFECEEDMLDGYYANVHYKCQVYHHCLSGIRYDFLCANYTAFDQKTFICHFVSEVDCANSAKFWNRNKGLYETPTTSTVKPLTLPPPPPTPPPAPRRQAAGGAGRRRRPYRRRRPQYDYYYDDEYDDEEYEDDLTAPAQVAGRSNRNRGQQQQLQRPNPVTPATQAASPSDPPADEKPFKADSSIYDRPRQVPKIRRPVPANERDKYDYPRKEAAGGSEKKEAAADRDYDRPSRPRAKPRPSQDDDEFYDDEDYEQPRSTSRKNNNQDYYAPTGQDRDFVRRPVMTGAGRPLRRNRPGAQRRPVYDDDYDDRRQTTAPEVESRRRPSDSEARRRPATYDDDEQPRRRPTTSEDTRRRPDDETRRRPADEPRRRPSEYDDESSRRPVTKDEPRRKPATTDDEPRRRPTVDEEPRRRPSVDDEYRRRPAVSDDESKRRPQADEEPRRRPSGSDEKPRRRPANEDDSQERPEVDSETKRRPVSEDGARRRPSSSEEDLRSRPTSTEVLPRRRGTTDAPRRAPVDTSEEDTRRKPATSSRTRTQQRDEIERDTVSERPQSNRESSKQKNNRDYSYDTLDADRTSAPPTGRDSINFRPLNPSGSSRQGNRDNRDSSSKTSQMDVFDERPVKGSTERNQAYNERPIQERPSGADNLRQTSAPSGSGSLYVRSTTLRNQPTTNADLELELPIPAAKPAYISMLGREGYRKKVHDEESRLSGITVENTRTSSKPVDVIKPTEAPKPVYDDEYYYDDDEEVEDEVTGSIKATGSSIVSLSPQGSTIKEEASLRKPLSSGSSVGTVSVVALGPGDVVRGRGQSSEVTRRIGPITESQSRTGQNSAQVKTSAKHLPEAAIAEKVVQEERTQTRPLGHTPAKKSPSSKYHFDEDGVLLETSTRAGFRPRSTTTQLPFVEKPEIGYKADQNVRPVTEAPVEDVHQRPLYSSRRKSNPAANVDSAKVLPTKNELKDLSGEVGVPPTGADYDNQKTKVVAEVFKSTEAPIRLETEIFELPKLKFETYLPTGPSGRGSIHYRKNVNDLPTRSVLPDISDPEYDVTLNEAVVHPTRNPFSADGASRVKVKVPVYHYRDAPVDYPINKQGTLLSSASQTHIAKAPYPIHEKYADSPKEEEDYENTTGEDEYDDIPTGKGASKVRYEEDRVQTSKAGPLKYEWTTFPTELMRDHASSIVTSRGATGNQHVASNTPRYYQQQQPQLQQQPQQQQYQQQQHQIQPQQKQQQQSGTRLPIREFTQQPFLSTVRGNNQQYYKPQPVSVDGYKAQPVQGADSYRGPVNPLLFSQSYDYDLTPKYRPRRKYAPFFGKPY